MDVKKIEDFAARFCSDVKIRKVLDVQNGRDSDRTELARTFTENIVTLACASNVTAILERIDKEINMASEAMETSPAYDDDRPYWKGYKEGMEAFKSWVKVHSRKEVDDEEARHGKS